MLLVTGCIYKKQDATGAEMRLSVGNIESKFGMMCFFYQKIFIYFSSFNFEIDNAIPIILWQSFLGMLSFHYFIPS